MTQPIDFIELEWRGRRLQIEYQWVGSDTAHPLLIFLHEGLGSLAMWKDFPQRLCAALNCAGLVYSRPGYGRSTARLAGEAWDVNFIQQQAQELLPKLLLGLGVDTQRNPPWLFGHSDGASIALVYAARFPDRVGAAILLAPHIMVEEISIASIERVRLAYLNTDLRDKLAPYHDDPDSAFWGWNDAWLNPAFRRWSIEPQLRAIRCPLLVVQGVDDEYGTLEQPRGIARRVGTAEVVEMADCRHSPHRDQPQRLFSLVERFYRAHNGLSGSAR